MFYKLVFMKENDYFKLINQLCFLLFLVCCTFFTEQELFDWDHISSVDIYRILDICIHYFA